LCSSFFLKKKLLLTGFCSGAHTIGVSHCSSFRSRLQYDNSSSSTSQQNPPLDTALASQLAQACPPGNDNTVPMDAGSADAFDTSYFQNLLANRGLLASDQTLTTDNATAALVEQNAYNMYLFATKFGDAMVKMGGIQVLTGSDGQIRTNCRALN
jgi:peroxidase